MRDTHAYIMHACVRVCMYAYHVFGIHVRATYCLIFVLFPERLKAISNCFVYASAVTCKHRQLRCTQVPVMPHTLGSYLLSAMLTRRHLHTPVRRVLLQQVTSVYFFMMSRPMQACTGAHTCVRMPLQMHVKTFGSLCINPSMRASAHGSMHPLSLSRSPSTRPNRSMDTKIRTPTHGDTQTAMHKYICL